MEQKDVSKTALSYFKFIYQLGKLTKKYPTYSFVAYLNKITTADISQKAFKPGSYTKIFNSVKNFYDVLTQRPLSLMRLDAAIDNINVIWHSIDGAKVIIDTNVSVDTEYIVEGRIAMIWAAALLIDSLLKNGKIRESDIILPPADEYCELLTTMISSGVLSDTRPKLVKNPGDTTFDDLAKMLGQKYLGQPVIKAIKGATTEVSDFIVDIIKKCWDKIAIPNYKVDFGASYTAANSIVVFAKIENSTGYYADTCYILNVNCISRGGRYEKFTLSDRTCESALEKYYQNGNSFKLENTPIEGALLALFSWRKALENSYMRSNG